MEVHSITLCSPPYSKPFLSKAQVGISGYKPIKSCSTVVGMPYLNGANSMPTGATEIPEIGGVIMGWFNPYNPASQQFRINILNQLKGYALIRKQNAIIMRSYFLSAISGSLVGTNYYNLINSYITASNHVIQAWANYIQLLEYEIIIIGNENAN